jgi:DNA topoisomerase-2
MQRLDDDIYMLLTKRAYDMAGLMPTVKVVINGKDINANTFSKYVNLYIGENSELPKIRDPNVDN